MPFTSSEFALWMSVAKDTSIVGLLLFILYGGARRVWIWGHHYLELAGRVEKLESEIDWWQERYLAMTDTTSKIVGLAERRRKP